MKKSFAMSTRGHTKDKLVKNKCNKTASKAKGSKRIGAGFSVSRQAPEH